MGNCWVSLQMLESRIALLVECDSSWSQLHWTDSQQARDFTQNHLFGSQQPLAQLATALKDVINEEQEILHNVSWHEKEEWTDKVGGNMHQAAQR